MAYWVLNRVAGCWLGILLITASAAHAVDGVIEINQAVVDSSGGFPFTIGARGSYRLTSNLTVPDANTTAINVTSTNVTIDLNGFSIVGPINSSGTGDGIFTTTGSLSVRNGTIRSVGRDGISGGGSFENVLVNGAGRHGFNLLDNGIVRNSRALGNKADGILAAGQCEIIDNQSNANTGRGIVAGTNARVHGNTVSENGGNGIEVGTGGFIKDNVSSLNGNAGIRCVQSCLISDNVVQGNSGPSNAGIGIQIISPGGTSGRSLVRGNVLTNNANVGLSFPATGSNADGYAGNLLSNNNTTQQEVSGGVNLGGNLCNGSTAAGSCN